MVALVALCQAKGQIRRILYTPTTHLSFASFFAKTSASAGYATNKRPASSSRKADSGFAICSALGNKELGLLLDKKVKGVLVRGRCSAPSGG